MSFAFSQLLSFPGNLMLSSARISHDDAPVLRIGLAVCRKLIDMMEGDIVLDENYNSGIEGSPGARFSIFLNRPPLQLDSALQPQDSHHAVELKDLTKTANDSDDDSVKDKALPKQCSVLFTDDDTILRRLFSRSLKKLMPTWTVHEAANGETALKLVEENHYDTIFMDQYVRII